MGYYTDQKNGIVEKLTEGTDILNNKLKIQIEEIRNELQKNGDASAEPHILNCSENITKIREDFILKIDEEIKNVEINAQKWQKWHDDIKAVSGNSGYEGAKSKGFAAWEETEKIVTIPGPKVGNIDYNTYKTVTIYYWTAYTDVAIDGNGYITFNIVNYKQENDKATVMRSSSATVASEADYITYYVNRGSIGGAG